MAIAKENKVVHGDDLTLIGQLIKAYFVAKETGKGLSTNDFTTPLKNKLESIDLSGYVTDDALEALTSAEVTALLDL